MFCVHERMHAPLFYMCECMHVHPCIHANMHAGMQTYMHACRHTCMHASLGKTSPSSRTLGSCLQMHTCLHAYRYTWIRMYIDLHRYLRTCIYTYTVTYPQILMQCMLTIIFFLFKKVQLCGIDFAATYQHAFVNLRQIAVFLRTALKVRIR